MDPITFAESKLEYNSKTKPAKISIQYSNGTHIVRLDCVLKGTSYKKACESKVLSFTEYPSAFEEEGHVYSLSALEDVLDMMKSKSAHVKKKVACMLEVGLTGNVTEYGFFKHVGTDSITVSNLSGSLKEWPVRQIRTLTCHRPLYSEFRSFLETFDGDKLDLMINCGARIVQYRGGYSLFAYKEEGKTCTHSLRIKLLDMADTPLISVSQIVYVSEPTSDDELEVEVPQKEQIAPKTVIAILQTSTVETKSSKSTKQKKNAKKEIIKVPEQGQPFAQKMEEPVTVPSIEKIILPISLNQCENSGAKKKSPTPSPPNSARSDKTVPNLLTQFDIEHKLTELYDLVIDDSLQSVPSKPPSKNELRYYLTEHNYYETLIKQKLKDCYGVLLRVVQGVAMTIDGYQPKDIPSACEYLTSFDIVDRDVCERFRSERNYAEHEDMENESMGIGAVKTLCLIHARIVDYVKSFVMNPQTKGGALSRFNEQFVPIKQSQEDLQKRLIDAITQVKTVLAMSEILSNVSD